MHSAHLQTFMQQPKALKLQSCLVTVLLMSSSQMIGRSAGSKNKRKGERVERTQGLENNGSDLQGGVMEISISTSKTQRCEGFKFS